MRRVMFTPAGYRWGGVVYREEVMGHWQKPHAEGV